MLRELVINEKDLRALMPTFAQRQTKLDREWQDLLIRAGLNAVCNELKIGEINNRKATGSHKELPPFMRIGRLVTKEKNHQGSDLQEVSEYLEKCEVAALLNFRDSSAVLSYSEIDPKRLALLFQTRLIQLLCNIDPVVVSCAVIDLKRYGRDYAGLAKAVPKSEIITKASEAREFFNKIEVQVTETFKAIGGADPLYVYNRLHRDSTVSYHFILVSSFEDLGDTEKEAIERLLNHDNAAKAGIYFFINFNTEAEYKEYKHKFPIFPRVYESGKTPEDARLDMKVHAGLDTFDDGLHRSLEVRQDAEERGLIDALISFCREQYENAQPEPVRLPLPKPAEAWKHKPSPGLRVPIGKGPSGNVYFELGGENSTVHHALVGGATGTGKTILLHTIILQVLGNYSPEEIRLSLLDYKGGTEFQCYKQVRHLYAISLGKKTKFGVDLLKHLKKELDRRHDEFKKYKAKDIWTYRKESKKIMARHLVIIDEFQVLFKENFDAQEILEDLIRRGRSVGFYFILSSQSVRDNCLTPPTKSELKMRICLRLSETDCNFFLEINNLVPVRFTYPGQAVLNDQEGQAEGNKPFRVAYYDTDEMSDFLKSMDSEKCGEPNSPIYEPFVYDQDMVLTADELKIEREPNSFLLGYEEGIPRPLYWVSLDPAKGPVLVIGTGEMKQRFDTHFQNELTILEERAKKIKFSDLPAEELESPCQEGETWEGRLANVQMLRIKTEEANDYHERERVNDLIAKAKSKVFIFLEKMSDLRQFSDLDQKADWVIYLDRKSIQDDYPFFKWQDKSIAAKDSSDGEIKTIQIPRSENAAT